MKKAQQSIVTDSSPTYQPPHAQRIEQLINKPMSVTELAEALCQEQSMISHNLKPLLDCNI